jgi:hypothetical protein
MVDRAAPRTVAVSRVVAAAPETVFAVLDDPAKHGAIDGSGTVRASRDPARHLVLGDRFAMDMKIGVPYRISSVVREYEKDRLIAWSHFGGHRWRYRLRPVEGGTEVTEEFDWSTSRAPWFIELIGYPRRHPPAMARTLDRLAALVASGTATPDPAA